MNKDWSNVEVELIVADYFSMLIDEIKGVLINKAEHRRVLIPLLNNRSKGSVEFKHQNISAVLRKFGLPYIRGYKPLLNYQSILEDGVRDYLGLNQSIERIFEDFAETVLSPSIVQSVNFENWVIPAPEPSIVSEPIPTYRKPIKVNYIEREQRNRNLGEQGEELVMKYEKWQLIKAGKESLAEKIEWVSKEQGDGLGFDILSRNLNGTDKYIEVKTTKLSKDAPIFFTKNELEFSISNSDNFHLYRVFDFIGDPGMFSVRGRYDQFCRVEPIQYKGSF